MGIGVSIFLLALGAILTFALDTSVSGIDLDVVGIILMGAGLVGLALTLLVFGRRDAVVTRRPAVAEEQVVTRRPAVAEERVVTRERDVY